jgi:type III secretory pathway component EscV
MTALIVVLVTAAVLVGLGFAFGGPALAILLILAGLVVVGWFVMMGLARRTPTEVASRAQEQEFLGPGGPDDPNR